jgi:uncharacterized phiE125 gp8 family phage protein
MPLRQIIPPVVPPMSIVEAKLYRRIEVTTDDSIVASLVSAATDYALTATQRQLVAARYQQILDGFPGPSMAGIPFGTTYTMQGNVIVLERCPVLQVVSITYTAMDGSTQTVDPTIYTVDLSGEPARIRPNFGQIWPINLPQMAAVTVTFDAGHATPVTVATGPPSTITPALWPPLAVGTQILLSNSGGALPAGLTLPPDQKAIQAYVQAVVSPGVYTVSLTPAGSAVVFTDIGSGINYLGQVPEGMKSWLQARLGTLYENREEVLVLNRGHLEELPYIDGLLDNFRMELF